MDLIQSVEQIFRYLEPVSIAFLILRLAAQKLLVPYKAFTAYLIIWLCQDLLPLLFGFSLGGDSYAKFFFISEPLAWLFSCLVLFELFDLTFSNFPGIRSAGKLLLGVAIAVAALVAAGTAVPGLLSVHGENDVLLFYWIVERSVMLITLVLLVALQYLILHYRLPLPRNTVIYSFTYAIFFATRALAAFVVSETGPRASVLVNVLAMAVDTACLVFWAFTLTRTGIENRVVPGPRLSTFEHERLRTELVGINEMMTRLRQR
jgi:hypothetical protein